MGAKTHEVGKSQKQEGKARIVYTLFKVKLLALVEQLAALIKRDFLYSSFFICVFCRLGFLKNSKCSRKISMLGSCFSNVTL